MQAAEILVAVVEGPAGGVLHLEHLGQAAEPLGAPQRVGPAVGKESVPLVGQVPGDDAGMVLLSLGPGQHVGAGGDPERVAVHVVLAGAVAHAGKVFRREEPVFVHVVGDAGPAAHRVVQVHAVRHRRGDALGLDGNAVEHNAGVFDPGLAESEPLAAEIEALAGGRVGDLDGQDVEVRVGGAPGLGVLPGLREIQRHGLVDFKRQFLGAQFKDLFSRVQDGGLDRNLNRRGGVVDHGEVGADGLFADRGGDEQSVGGDGGRGLDGNVAHVNPVDRFP